MRHFEKSKRANKKGRNNTDRFVRLPYSILNSNAYRSLSPNDRALLIELMMLYNGENNGSLYLSVRDAASRMGISDPNAASKSFNTLQVMRFIELTMPSQFRSGSSDRSRARCWRLCWLAGPDRKAPDWRLLQSEPAPKSKERKRMEAGLRTLKRYTKARDNGKFPVLDSDTLSQFASKKSLTAVSENKTPDIINSSFLPKPCVMDFPTHIAITIGECVQDNQTGWQQSDWSMLTANLTSLLTFPDQISTLVIANDR